MKLYGADIEFDPDDHFEDIMDSLTLSDIAKYLQNNSSYRCYEGTFDQKFAKMLDDHARSEALESIYKYFSPAEIFEWLVLFYPDWLKSYKHAGGGKEYIAKMTGLIMVEDESLLIKEMTGAEIWEYLRTFHAELLNQFVKDNLYMSKEMMWEQLRYKYPDFLSKQIGDLIMEGKVNGD